MIPTLCVITGPVGAGKSTTSIALTVLLRERGRRAAVIDLDQVARQRDGFDDPIAWDALRWLHDNFAAAQPHLQEIGELLNAQHLTPQQLAPRIAASMEWP